MGAEEVVKQVVVREVSVNGGGGVVEQVPVTRKDGRRTIGEGGEDVWGIVGTRGL